MLDAMEFGRRLAVERDLERSGQSRYIRATFDETGHFLLYPSLFGVKGKWGEGEKRGS